MPLIQILESFRGSISKFYTASETYFQESFRFWSKILEVFLKVCFQTCSPPQSPFQNLNQVHFIVGGVISFWSMCQNSAIHFCLYYIVGACSNRSTYPHANSSILKLESTHTHANSSTLKLESTHMHASSSTLQMPVWYFLVDTFDHSSQFQESVVFLTKTSKKNNLLNCSNMQMSTSPMTQFGAQIQPLCKWPSHMLMRLKLCHVFK